jgi:hypothetical protein
MLQVMHGILTRLLEREPVFTIHSTPFDVNKPSDTPPETTAMKANGPRSPGAGKASDLPPVPPAVAAKDLENTIARGEAPSPLDEPKGPTLADLKAALQDCIEEHGMEVARKRLAPYATYSMVPVDKLQQKIDEVKGVKSE